MRSPRCRRQLADHSPTEHAALASGGPDHALDHEGVGKHLMKGHPGSLLRWGPIMKIGETATAVEALAADVGTAPGVGPNWSKFRSTNEAGTLGSKWSHLPVYVGSVTVIA